MNYTQEMNLQSKSGYCMPFEERKGEVRMSLDYGTQVHPKTGEEFFHHGIDFITRHYLLSACADGIVSVIGSDARHGLFQVIRYGKYEVTYAHLTNVLATFGAKVKAGSVASVSGELLHIEVKYDGQEINPLEFLAMIYGNLKMLQQQGGTGMPDFETIDMDIPTDFEDNQEEVEELMLRFYPDYLAELNNGKYLLPQHTEQSLRNIFSLSAIKNYFYEAIPSLSNPLGIGQRAMPVAAKVQNLLIADFLNYMALRHQIFLSTLSESEKKTLDEAHRSGGIIDPLAELEIDVQSFDIPKLITVYPDQAGIRWWTKAWFNNQEEGENSIEVTRQTAVHFLQHQIDKDTMLEEYFPKQMEIYRNAIEQTRVQLLKQINIS
jgi:formylmethanofuran dehydrogenase subunit D